MANSTVTAKFVFCYATNNKYRFDEVDDKGTVVKGGQNTVVGALYLNKKNFKKNPTKKTTVEAIITIE